MHIIKYYVLLISCLITIQTISGQKTTTKKFIKKRFKLKVGLSSTYDDNILKYSDKYISRFLNNEDSGRFEIETYDDVFVKTKLSTSYYFTFFKKKKKYKTQISATVLNNAYLKNSIKSWRYYGVGVKQYFSKKASIKFAYSYIPEFYVRQFRQYDLVELYGYTPQTFKPYVFAKDNYSVTFQNTFLKKYKIILDFDKAIYYHNRYYTEYDSKNLSASMLVEYAVTKKIKINAGYLFTVSDAKGFDEIGETKETADESDGTYQDDTFIVGAKVKLPKILKKKTNLSIKATFSKRYFSSAHLIHEDPLHVGRTDQNIRLYLTYNVKLSKKANASLYYNYYIRDSYNNQGKYDIVVSEEKDYKQNQVGIQYTYAFY